MRTDLVDRITKILAPNGYKTVAEVEDGYPKRQLPSGAEVMRTPPSPTGFVHIGTIYAGFLNERIAHRVAAFLYCELKTQIKSVRSKVRSRA